MDLSQDRLAGLTATDGPEGDGKVFTIYRNGTVFTLLHHFRKPGTKRKGHQTFPPARVPKEIAQ